MYIAQTPTIKTTTGKKSKAPKKSMARFLDEFEWYARALKAERDKGVPR